MISKTATLPLSALSCIHVCWQLLYRINIRPVCYISSYGTMRIFILYKFHYENILMVGQYGLVVILHLHLGGVHDRCRFPVVNSESVLFFYREDQRPQETLNSHEWHVENYFYVWTFVLIGIIQSMYVYIIYRCKYWMFDEHVYLYTQIFIMIYMYIHKHSITTLSNTCSQGAQCCSSRCDWTLG